MSAFEIIWHGEKLRLFPERAVHWPREQTLFIADPHFGKASTFRHAGIAVPETSHEDDLARLSLLLKRCRPKRLVILGDFLHAKAGRSIATLAALEQWRSRHSKLEIILVLGNHDAHAGHPPESLNIQCVSGTWPLGPFLCRHHPPLKKLAAPVLAGHVHPAFHLYERTGASAHAVCFHFGAQTAVLPAFGSFTGTHPIKPVPGDQLYLIAGPEIIDATRLIRSSR